MREVQSVRERERERETEVVRQKWRHHCRAKNLICDKFALSLAKNSHFNIVSPSHFPSLPSGRGHQRRKWRHHCRAKIGNKFALSLAKNSHLSFPPSHFPSLPSRRGHLYETSKNSIKLIPKTIGNRKRDCAWGCAGVKKLKKNQLLSTNHYQAKQIWVLMTSAQQLIFLQFFNTHASSRTISFSISNSFWIYIFKSSVSLYDLSFLALSPEKRQKNDWEEKPRGERSLHVTGGGIYLWLHWIRLMACSFCTDFGLGLQTEVRICVPFA